MQSLVVIRILRCQSTLDGTDWPLDLAEGVGVSMQITVLKRNRTMYV